MSQTAQNIAKLKSEVGNLARKVESLTAILRHNADAAIQDKYVSIEVAKQITKLSKSAIMEKSIVRDPVNGVFNVYTGAKPWYFLRADLETYVKANSTET